MCEINIRKYLFVLVAVICFGFTTTLAQSAFRTHQTVCSETCQIVLKTNGTYQVWENLTTLLYSGEYIIDENAIIMTVEGEKVRIEADINKSKTRLWSLTFKGVLYRICKK